MYRRWKIIIGMGLFVVVLLSALISAFYYLVTRSFPVTEGTSIVTGISRPIEIHRDTFGVPHIKAETTNDGYFGVGYVHAQDRLWQMEFIRRAGEGRLSEIFGKETVPFDRLFRAVGMDAKAREVERRLDPDTRSALQAYANGVNAFIASNKGKFPIEFDLLNFDPEPWEIRHSLLVGKLMAWELNMSRFADAVFFELLQRVGPEKAQAVFPEWDPSAPAILQSLPEKGSIVRSLRAFRETESAYRNFAGLFPTSSGSNAWVVSGARSYTGKPLLANDPHLIPTAPGRWYELQLTSPSVNVLGMSLAGIPFVVIGRNDSIAWGLTNLMLDDQDYYVEELALEQQPPRYLLDGKWIELHSREEIIHTDRAEPETLIVYETHRGPIITEFEPGAELTKAYLSLRWSGHEPSVDARTFMLLNRAQNKQDFLNALSHFGSPAQNFVYADVSGTIGYCAGGMIPKRRAKSGLLPLPGTTSQFDWNGYLPFDENPRQFNPPSGYIATANNHPDPGYPYYLSHLWEPPYRIMRIEEILRSRELHSVQDFKEMQNDLLSVKSREIIPLILESYEGIDTDAETKKSLTYLRNYNHIEDKDSPAATLFHSFYTHLVRNIFIDEMGGDLFAVYDTLSATPINVVRRLLGTESDWFDDITTPQIENKRDIIRRSFADGISYLQKTGQGDLPSWKWGLFHTKEYGHILGNVPYLRSLFNHGPYATGGSHSTLNKGDYSFGSPFKSYVTPSMRLIFDLSDKDKTYSIMPPGQSGQPFHRHYGDQIHMFLNGLYRTQTMDWYIHRSARNMRLLVLHPESR